MDIILKKDVIGLGYKYEVVSVKRGYAFYYLIPNDLAEIATDSARKTANENQKQGLQKQQRLREEALELSKKMESDSIRFEVNESKKFGISPQVSVKNILAELKANTNYNKHDFNHSDIKLDVDGGVIKKIGEYKAEINIYRDIVGKIKIVVVSKKKNEKD